MPIKVNYKAVDSVVLTCTVNADDVITIVPDSDSIGFKMRTDYGTGEVYLAKEDIPKLIAALQVWAENP